MGMKEFFSDFTQLYHDKHIVNTIIITIISNFFLEFATSFNQNIIDPIINRDGDNNNIPDIKKLQNWELKILGIKFKLGLFLSSLIKAITGLIFVYFVINLLKKVK